MHKIVPRCIRLPQLTSDIKRLKKRFRSSEIDLKYAERLLEAGQVLPQADPYLGFESHKIFNMRVVNTHSARGKSAGYRLIYEKIEDESSLQEGAALAIYAETSSGNLMGSDRAGRPGRSSESIGRYVAERFVEDVKTGAAVDRYIADQLIIYAGLAEGVTRYSVPCITEHVEINLWLIKEFLGARTKIEGNFLEIKGVSFA